MTTYGEGHAGVVLISEQGTHTLGRTFKLSALGDISKLVERCTPGALEPGLVEYLGDAYQKMRGTAFIVPSAGPAPHPGTGPGAPSGTPEWMEALDKDLEDSMPTDLRAKSAENRRILAEGAAIRIPEVGPEQAARYAQVVAERTRQDAYSEALPDEMRTALMALLAAPEGTTVRRAESALGASRMSVYRWLTRLQFEGAARLHGKGRGARWHAAGATDSDQ